MTTISHSASDTKTLGEYLRDARRAKGLTAVEVARRCKIGKTHLADLENDRTERGCMPEATARLLAAVLDVPISEIAARVVGVTDTDRQEFADYQRVLRSNARALQALGAMNSLRDHVLALKCDETSNDKARELAQAMETTLKTLDAVLRYADRRVVRRCGDTGALFSVRQPAA